jgi:hypothetical protein
LDGSYGYTRFRHQLGGGSAVHSLYRGGNDFSYPKVKDLNLTARRYDYISGFNVTVNEPAGMCFIKRISYLKSYVCNLRGIERMPVDFVTEDLIRRDGLFRGA